LGAALLVEDDAAVVSVLDSIDSVVDSNGASGYLHALGRARIRGDFQGDFQVDSLDDFRDGSQNNSLDGFLGNC
jgi:hypothetical protein